KLVRVPPATKFTLPAALFVSVEPRTVTVERPPPAWFDCTPEAPFDDMTERVMFIVTFPVPRSATTPLPAFRLLVVSAMDAVIGPPAPASSLMPPPALLLVRVLSMETLSDWFGVETILMPVPLPVISVLAMLT